MKFIEKPKKIFFRNLFSIYKKVCKKYQKASEKEKTKSVNMLVNDVEIFLKKKNEKKHQDGCEWYRNLPEDKK